MSDYETFQLQWMIDHGHSLHELMEELQSLQYDDPRGQRPDFNPDHGAVREVGAGQRVRV